MKKYTQSDTDHGDCWQTALACILEVSPALLPPQVEIEQWDNKVLGGWGSYKNSMNGYLRKHHCLEYSTIYQPSFPAVILVSARHIICGPTVRTLNTNRNHCVVGLRGKVVWDPHPSRDGLTEHTEWGILGEYIDRPPSIMRSSKPELHDLVFGCLCPACGLSEARSLASKFVEQKSNEGWKREYSGGGVRP